MLPRRPCLNSLIESCKRNKVNPLSYMTYLLTHARNKNERLLLPTEFDGSNIAHIGSPALCQDWMSSYSQAVAEYVVRTFAD